MESGATKKVQLGKYVQILPERNKYDDAGVKIGVYPSREYWAWFFKGYDDSLDSWINGSSELAARGDHQHDYIKSIAGDTGIGFYKTENSTGTKTIYEKDFEYKKLGFYIYGLAGDNPINNANDPGNGLTYQTVLTALTSDVRPKGFQFSSFWDNAGGSNGRLLYRTKDDNGIGWNTKFATIYHSDDASGIHNTVTEKWYSSNLILDSALSHNLQLVSSFLGTTDLTTNQFLDKLLALRVLRSKTPNTNVTIIASASNVKITDTGLDIAPNLNGAHLKITTHSNTSPAEGYCKKNGTFAFGPDSTGASYEDFNNKIEILCIDGTKFTLTYFNEPPYQIWKRVVTSEELENLTVDGDYLSLDGSSNMIGDIRWLKDSDLFRMGFRTKEDTPSDGSANYAYFVTGDNETEYFKFGHIGMNNEANAIVLTDPDTQITEWTTIKADGIRTKAVWASNGFWAESDIKLKSNLELISSNKIKQLYDLPIYNYDKLIVRDNQEDEIINEYGVVAQDIEKIFPNVVTEVDGIKSVNYIQLSVLSLRLIQNLNERVIELENKLL